MKLSHRCSVQVVIAAPVELLRARQLFNFKAQGQGGVLPKNREATKQRVISPSLRRRRAHHRTDQPRWPTAGEFLHPGLAWSVPGMATNSVPTALPQAAAAAGLSILGLGGKSRAPAVACSGLSPHHCRN